MAIHPWPVTEPAKGSAVQPSWSELSHKKAGETETAGMRSSFQDTFTLEFFRVPVPTAVKQSG